MKNILLRISDKVIYMQPCIIFRFLFNISEIPTVISLPEVLYSVIFLSDQLGFLYMKAVLCNFPHQWDSVVRYFVSKARNKEEEKLPNQRIREALKELIVVNNDEYSFVLDYCVSVLKGIKSYKKSNGRICVLWQVKFLCFVRRLKVPRYALRTHSEVFDKFEGSVLPLKVVWYYLTCLLYRLHRWSCQVWWYAWLWDILGPNFPSCICWRGCSLTRETNVESGYQHILSKWNR